MFPKRFPTREKPIVYPKVGRCIYCGSAGDETGLSREHIIPLGLGGSFVLPAASCRRCAAITGRVENKCLNDQMGPWRAMLQLQSNRRKTPKKFKINVVRGPYKIAQRVPVEDTFIILELPELFEPGVLAGRPVQRGPLLVKRQRPHWFAENYEQVTRKHGTFTQRHDRDPITFIRMLAKIAHSLAVAEIGLENFSPVLAPVILGTDLEIAASYIGQSQWLPDPTTPGVSLHEIGLRLIPDERVMPVRFWVVVRIRLFCESCTTTYAVVAGELTPTSSILHSTVIQHMNDDFKKQFRLRYGL